MIYTVTFNPAVDYVVYTNNIAEGLTNRTNKEEYYFGGKGINISKVLNSLGVESTALGFIGGFTGNAIEKSLQGENIKTNFISVKNGISRINIKIKNHTETELNGNGPDISLDELNLLFKILKSLSKEDIVILAGSVPKSVDNDVYERIALTLSEKDIPFVVDASGKLLLNTLKHKPFLIKPNKQELCDIFNVKNISKEDVLIYGDKLQKMGAKNVLISLGKDGAYLFDQFKNIHYSHNLEGDVINTVGSGDSMIAGFIAGYIHKQDYEFALKLGTICGNATAMKKDLADYDKIKELYNKY